MKLHLIGLMVFALAGACGNTATSERAAAPTPAAGGVQQNTPVGKTTTTGEEQQAAQVQGDAPLPNAGSKAEAAPGSPQPPPARVPVGTAPPGPPRPANTGDPCPWCK